MQMNEITGVVLAGGKSTRFGGIDKAFVPIGGVPMVAKIIERLGKLFDNIIVVTGNPSKYKTLSRVKAVGDILKNHGPLGGIHSAMVNSNAPFIFVVSCDMPFIDTGIILKQIALIKKFEAEAYVIRVDSIIQPLHAIYCCSLADKLHKFISSSSDHSVMAFLRKLNAGYLDIAGNPDVHRAFININIPQDINPEA